MRAILLVLVLGCLLLNAASLSEERASEFLGRMIQNPSQIEEFISPNDLEISSRLGIVYEGVAAKPLISWEISQANLTTLKTKGIAGSYRIEEVGDNQSKLTIFPENQESKQSWIFEDQFLVSSILAQTSSWSTIESKHFKFIISDTTKFHSANIDILEGFLYRMSDLLEFSQSDMDLLAQKKIIYCFCSSKKEIKELTGHAPRGMYVLSHDIIMSTYSSHLHELAHLLINFKLRTLKMYTHPLLLEGFAVSTGGRGGKTPEILNELGAFLLSSEWVSIEHLSAVSGFYSQNASMSYPSSGTYVRYLIEEVGIERFLELYREYSSTSHTSIPEKIDISNLHTGASWAKYLEDTASKKSIRPFEVSQVKELVPPFSFHYSEEKGSILFGVPSQSLYQGPSMQKGYSSFLFKELMPEKEYPGSKYYIRASDSEVGVYDLHTNTMIAFYAQAFSDPPMPVTTKDGLFYFEIHKNVFENFQQELIPNYEVE